jgi:hypothetical protein
VLNLAAKLCLTNPKQTKLLTQYVLNLAKYDMNYDIRDRQGTQSHYSTASSIEEYIKKSILGENGTEYRYQFGTGTGTQIPPEPFFSTEKVFIELRT